MSLTIDNEWVDCTSNIVNCRVASNFIRARYRIDFDLAYVTAIGKTGVSMTLSSITDNFSGKSERLQLPPPMRKGKSLGRYRRLEIYRREIQDQFPRPQAPRLQVSYSSISSSAAFTITVPAIRIERPLWDPPPTFTRSVSPTITEIVLTGTPNHSAAT